VWRLRACVWNYSSADNEALTSIPECPAKLIDEDSRMKAIVASSAVAADAAGRRRGEKVRKTYLLVLLGLVAGRHWFSALGSGLWLDETGSFWVIQQGLGHIYSRALIDMVSPVYSVILWGAARLLGPHEWALRLPSIIAVSFAVFLIYRLCARLFDRETGLLAAVVLVCLPSVSFAATYARSYGAAFVTSVAATLLLVRWLDTGAVRDSVAYVLLSALAVYLHYLFATILLVHAVFAAAHSLVRNRVKLRAMIAVASLLILLLLPLVPYLHALYQARAAHTWSPRPELVQLFEALVPAVTCASLSIGVLVASLFWPGFELRASHLTRSTGVLLGCWLALPPAILFVVARLTNAGVFLPRYYLPMNAGFAVLAAWLLRAIEPVKARLVVVTLVAVASILSYGGMSSFWISRGDDDWRAATHAVDVITSDAPATPVFFHTGFVEADDYHWLADPERRSLLLAPLSIYPARGNMIPLPYTLNPKSTQHLEETIAPLVRAENRFLLVTKGPDSRLFEMWFQWRFARDGFSLRSLGNFGAVSVFLFKRPMSK
jgi:mannosyltransferase